MQKPKNQGYLIPEYLENGFGKYDIERGIFKEEKNFMNATAQENYSISDVSSDVEKESLEE